MKTLIILSALAITTQLTMAQRQSSDKMYWIALQKYTAELSKSYPKEVYYGDEKIIYLEKPLFMDSVPPKINGYNIVILTFANKKDIYLKHKRILVHTEISPIHIENDKVSITITPYGGRMINRRHYNLTVGDGTTVYFKYDCDKKEFIFDKTINWGI
jgi:hypothetical protein